MHTPSPCGGLPAPALTCARWGTGGGIAGGGGGGIWQPFTGGTKRSWLPHDRPVRHCSLTLTKPNVLRCCPTKRSSAQKCTTPPDYGWLPPSMGRTWPLFARPAGLRWRWCGCRCFLDPGSFAAGQREAVHLLAEVPSPAEGPQTGHCNPSPAPNEAPSSHTCWPLHCPHKEAVCPGLSPALCSGLSSPQLRNAHGTCLVSESRGDEADGRKKRSARSVWGPCSRRGRCPRPGTPSAATASGRWTPEVPHVPYPRWPPALCR